MAVASHKGARSAGGHIAALSGVPLTLERGLLGNLRLLRRGHDLQHQWLHLRAKHEEHVPGQHIYPDDAELRVVHGGQVRVHEHDEPGDLRPDVPLKARLHGQAAASAASAAAHVGAEKVPVRWSPVGNTMSKLPTVVDELACEIVMEPLVADRSVVPGSFTR